MLLIGQLTTLLNGRRGLRFPMNEHNRLACCKNFLLRKALDHYLLKWLWPELLLEESHLVGIFEDNKSVISDLK